jgi:cobalt/nickel transport system permease protein
VHRMLFLLLDTASAVRDAQAARLGHRTWRTTYRSVAGQAAAVFVAAFDRARRLEDGLALRGYDGALRVVVEHRPVSRPFLLGAALLVGAVAATGALA